MLSVANLKLQMETSGHRSRGQRQGQKAAISLDSSPWIRGGIETFPA